MLIDENTELDGRILCYMTGREDYYHCYTFKLKDVEKVIKYYGDIHTYYNLMDQYICCRGSNIRVSSHNDDGMYQEALIKLKNGLYLISYISFRIFEDKSFKLNKINFLSYFKEHNLYEERNVIDLYEDLENFIVTSNSIYTANPSLYRYICPNYKCSNNSKSEENTEAILKIEISETNIEKFDYIVINGIKFKKDEGK